MSTPHGVDLAAAVERIDQVARVEHCFPISLRLSRIIRVHEHEYAARFFRRRRYTHAPTNLGVERQDLAQPMRFLRREDGAQ